MTQPVSDKDLNYTLKKGIGFLELLDWKKQKWALDVNIKETEAIDSKFNLIDRNKKKEWRDYHNWFTTDTQMVPCWKQCDSVVESDRPLKITCSKIDLQTLKLHAQNDTAAL